jgi:hypothetical protein
MPIEIGLQGRSALSVGLRRRKRRLLGSAQAFTPIGNRPSEALRARRRPSPTQRVFLGRRRPTAGRRPLEAEFIRHTGRPTGRSLHADWKSAFKGACMPSDGALACDPGTDLPFPPPWARGETDPKGNPRVALIGTAHGPERPEPLAMAPGPSRFSGQVIAFGHRICRATASSCPTCGKTGTPPTARLSVAGGAFVMISSRWPSVSCSNAVPCCS